MDDAKLYAKFHNYQKWINSRLLAENLHQLEFKDGENYFEVGCGVGQSTSQLLNVIPTTYNKFVATDILENMIQEAKVMNPLPRVEYAQFDITAKSLPAAYENSFDKVFALCAMHWINASNTRQAYENMGKLLRKDGDLILVLVGLGPPHLVNEKMFKNKKWSSYIDQQELHSPYNTNIKENAERLFAVLVENNFDLKLYHKQKIIYQFKSQEEFENTAKAINSFISRIPGELQEEYWNDVLTEFGNVSEVRKTGDFWNDYIFLHAKKM